MKASTALRNVTMGVCGVIVGLTMGGCNTTKATVDTTVNFFSSTSPNELFSSDGMVVKEQKINLFAGQIFQGGIVPGALENHVGVVDIVIVILKNLDETVFVHDLRFQIRGIRRQSGQGEDGSHHEDRS